MVADLIVGSIQLGLIHVEPDERPLSMLGRSHRRRLLVHSLSCRNPQIHSAEPSPRKS
jgi:hypothetical protein